MCQCVVCQCVVYVCLCVVCASMCVRVCTCVRVSLLCSVCVCVGHVCHSVTYVYVLSFCVRAFSDSVSPCIFPRFLAQMNMSNGLPDVWPFQLLVDATQKVEQFADELIEELRAVL